MNTIYTIGYSLAHPEDIKAIVDNKQATLVDIRLKPYSSIPCWQGWRIRDFIGSNRYVHMEALGNLNYKDGPIQLNRPELTVASIYRLLERGPVILLCVCRDVETCHRKVAAEYLAEKLGAPIEHLTPDVAPTGPGIMKCLTLTQPWATLMTLGAKAIETRSWATAYRGPLAIHAAKSFPRLARTCFFDNPYHDVLTRAGYTSPNDLPLGAVLGTVDVVDCKPTISLIDITPQERAFGDYTPGRFGFVTENVRRFETPIPATGSLGLWSWPVPKGIL